jgi:hypothetical protein
LTALRPIEFQISGMSNAGDCVPKIVDLCIFKPNRLECIKKLLELDSKPLAADWFGEAFVNVP